MLLGELLVREGVITMHQLERALELREQAQVRLGTTLVELGFLDVDTLARALSAQHKVPAVLTKHVAAIEPRVIGLFPVRVATLHNAIPVGYTSSKPPRLVVAFRDPTSTPMDDIAFAAGARIEVGVAPEMLIHRCLTKYYGVESKKYIDVDIDEMRRNPSSDPPAPAPAVVKASLPVLDPPAPSLPRGAPILEAPSAPSLSVPPAPAPAPAPAPEPEPEPEPAPAPAPKAKSVAPPPVVAITKPEDELPSEEDWDAPPPPPPAPAGPLTAPPEALLPVIGVDEALAAMKDATSRDAIGETLATWLRSAYGIGLVLIVKDGLGMALGWRGYAPDVDASAIESIAMPLGPPSMLTSAYEGKTSYRGPPPEVGMPIQKKLWNLLRCEPPKEVLVTPVLVSNRVVNILYAHGALSDSALEDAARVAAAAGTAYAKLIRKTR